jgi:hypothetical protein
LAEDDERFELSESFSFFCLKLLLLHLNEAFAKCHARLGRILIGGYSKKAFP